MASRKKEISLSRKKLMQKRGAPAFYKTAEEMQKRIDVYFAGCNEDNPPTVSGLALFLGFCDRQSVYDYKSRNSEFSYTIKKAISTISDFAEKCLFNGKTATGAIFWLKNHHWSDELKTDNTTTVVVKSAADLRQELEGGSEE